MSNVSHRGNPSAAPAPVSLSAAIAAYAGRTLVLAEGTYALDDNVVASTTLIKLSHGVVITVASDFTLGSQLDFSAGGLIRPASGVTVSLTGALVLSSNHYAFDVSLGGTVAVDEACIDKLTPRNFGATGDATTYDDAALEACRDACLSSSGAAFGGIPMELGPGRFRTGSTMVRDERSDWVQTTFDETGATVRGSARAVTSIKFNPTEADLGELFVCHRFEEKPPAATNEPTVYPTVEKLSYTANGDTTRRKVALDVHDGRRLVVSEVAVEVWTDTSRDDVGGSIGVRLRGRDVPVLEKCFLDCDFPVVISQNDNEEEPLDSDNLPTVWRDTSQKDLDHANFHDCTFQADNARFAAVWITPGTVVRSLSISGDTTCVGGSILQCIDLLDSGTTPYGGAAVQPRRQSDHWQIGGSGRIEGLNGFISDAKWAVNIARHENNALRELVIEGDWLLGEGYDARRNQLIGGSTGLTGSAWHGIKATGVERVHIGEGVRYCGAGTPLVVDDNCLVTIEDGVILCPEDQNHYYPEHEDQFTFLGTYVAPGFLGFDSWYQLNDEQDDLPQDFADVFDLDPAGVPTPTYQQLRDGSIRYWLNFGEVANQKIRISTVDFGVSGTDLAMDSHSKMFAGVYQMDTGWTPGGIRELMNLSGDAAGARVRLNVNGTLFILANGVSGTASTLSVLDGQRFLLTCAHNRTANTLEACITKLDGTREIITGTYFASPGNDQNQGWGAYTGSVSSWQGGLTWAAIALDAKAEQDQETVHDALGWVEDV